METTSCSLSQLCISLIVTLHDWYFLLTILLETFIYGSVVENRLRTLMLGIINMKTLDQLRRFLLFRKGRDSR